MRRLNNHVMWDAFAAIEVDSGPLVGFIIQAMRRNVPAKIGGWRVINRRGRDGRGRK